MSKKETVLKTEKTHLLQEGSRQIKLHIEMTFLVDLQSKKFEFG